MEKQRLIETLEDLHAELSRADDADLETIALLEKLTADLQRLLEKRGAKSAAELEPATSGLKDLLLKYEADHPQLSVVLGRVADALAAMGF
jgi:hypothetical protein